MRNKFKKYFANDNVQESVFFMLLGIALMVYALKNHDAIRVDWKMSPYLFPVLISIFMIFLSISLFFDGRYQIRENKGEKRVKNNGKSALVVAMALVLYYVLLPILTFIPATVLFLLAMFFFLGERKGWLMAVLSISTAASIYFIFGRMLHVILP